MTIRTTLLLRRYFTLTSMHRTDCDRGWTCLSQWKTCSPRYDVGRTPVLPSGPPLLARAGLRLRFGARKAPGQPDPDDNAALPLSGRARTGLCGCMNFFRPGQQSTLPKALHFCGMPSENADIGVHRRKMAPIRIMCFLKCSMTSSAECWCPSSQICGGIGPAYPSQHGRVAKFLAVIPIALDSLLHTLGVIERSRDNFSHDGIRES